MVVYLIKRLLLLPPVLIGVTLVVFFAVELIPGNLAVMLSGKAQDPAVIARLEAEWGLNEPMHVRYGTFIWKVAVEQDLGKNPETNLPVAGELGRYFAATIELTIAAILIASFVGINLGIAAARRPDGFAGVAALGVAYAGVSVPIFWLAILATSVFAVTLGWLPTGGRIDPWLEIAPLTGLYLVDSVLSGNIEALRSAVKHLILPACVLATVPMAIIVRLTRASMIEELSREYVRTARAKGLSENSVVRRHALKNALIPILTTTGAQFGYLLSGAVLTETVFAWPGLGRYVVSAVQSQNTPALAGGVLLMALIFVLVNLATDIAYAVIDPRVRLGGSGAE